MFNSLAFFFCSNTILFTMFDGSIDCGFFMLTNVNSYHDGVLANYSHENIGDIRKTWLYSIASSNLFETDFQSLFGYYTCKYLEVGLLTCTASFIIPELHIFFSNLDFCLRSGWAAGFGRRGVFSLYMNFISIFF